MQPDINMKESMEAFLQNREKYANDIYVYGRMNVSGEPTEEETAAMEECLKIDGLAEINKYLIEKREKQNA
jgi:hypothetical protein